MNAIDVIKFH